MYERELLIALEYRKQLLHEAEEYRLVRQLQGDHPSFIETIRHYLGEPPAQPKPAETEIEVGFCPDPAAA